jgi:hypothetical protein
VPAATVRTSHAVYARPTWAWPRIHGELMAVPVRVHPAQWFSFTLPWWSGLYIANVNTSDCRKRLRDRVVQRHDSCLVGLLRLER